MVPSEQNLLSFTPDVSGLQIRPANILAGLGMKIADADTYLLNLIEKYTDDCKSICSPRAALKFYQAPYFNQINHTLELDGLALHIGSQVMAPLKKSISIGFFIGTIGGETDLLAKHLFGEGHSLEGLIVDLIGSELAEEVAENIHTRFEQYASLQGMGISNRYSPGYCNWPVTDQHQLFSLMHDHCGIELTSTSLMLPVKSVSGLLGMGHQIKKAPYKCKICSDTDCILRQRS